MARYKRTYNPCDDCPYSYSKNNQDSGMCKICEFKELLDTTADVVEVRHGEWIEMAEYEHGGIKKIFFVCPLCGRVEYQKEPYCHCGARMDGNEK